MAGKNKQIIDIHVRSHIALGGTIEEQAKVLSLVAKAHETGDYSDVLKLATIDGVKAEMKRRRFEGERELATYEETMAALTNDSKRFVERITEDGRITYTGKIADKKAIADYKARTSATATDDGDPEIPAFLRR